MKKILYIILIAVYSISLAKEIEVPRVVADGFKQKFFNAQSVDWEMEGKNYKANFKMSIQNMCAIYSEEGDWIETKIFFDKSFLDKKIIEFISNKYPKSKIEKCAGIETNSKEQLVEVNIKFKDKKIKLLFSEDGKPIEIKK